MKKYLILREPIELFIPQITEVRNTTRLGYRLIVLDNGIGEVEALEGSFPSPHEEFKIGDLIKYDVNLDEFCLFDKEKLPPFSKLIEISVE